MMYNNGYNQMPQMKIPRPTKRNVEDFLSNIIMIPTHLIRFERIDEEPLEWKHACKTTGVGVTTNPNVAVFPDGTHIKYIVCYRCPKITYHLNEY